ncbi:MAG TPA: hypothetical protein VHG51_05675 [Longimicrobiaceae bacterium]|nr:hypothetical protein [Longimicrobiaceae bacterium]
MNNPYVGHEPAAASPQVSSARGLATIVYALQAASVVVGVTMLAAVILNYVKMDEARGTWVESHFRWQIRTFWLGLLWGVILFVLLLLLGLGTAGAAAVGSDAGAAGGALSVMAVGALGGLGIFVWFVYRVVKGWLRLSENQPI